MRCASLRPALALAIASWIGFPACAPPGQERTPPDLVLLISLDTLRADRLDLYGYERETAPNLRQLGEAGVVFERAYSQSAQTLTSHKSIFSAKYPASVLGDRTNATLAELTRVEDPFEFTVNGFIAAQESLFPLFQEAGYQTAAFTDGGWMDARIGFDQGFDTFDDQGGGFVQILASGFDWLQREPSKPQLLLLHTYDIHCPFPCREPYNSRYCKDHDSHSSLAGLCGKGEGGLMELAARNDRDREAISDHYDGGILSADEFLGQFLTELKKLDRFEEALIVIFSDHGESLGEGGQVGHGGLRLEQLRVPLIFKFPASWGISGARIDEPVEMIDMLPTVLELCGIESPRDRDGRSLTQVLFGGAEGTAFVVGQTTFQEEPHGATNPAKRTVVEPGRFQYVEDARNDEQELYDLSADPDALSDVFRPDHPSLGRLRKALRSRDRTDSSGAFQAPSQTEIDPDLQETLNKLGYAGGE